jgi:hypothetical protein
MHLAEEVKEALPEVILTALLSLIVHSEKPFYDKTAFFTILLNSLLEQSKSLEHLKKFKGQVEEFLSKFIFQNVNQFSKPS